MKYRLGMDPRLRPTGVAEGISVIDPEWEWPEFWVRIQDQLKRTGHRPSTRRVYRNALRAFRMHSKCRPAQLCHRHIRDYLRDLGRRRLSASWIGMNISVLRSVFDRICGGDLTEGIRGPRYPFRLPEILKPDEIQAILDGAESLRDRLLLGLMYGCGLKVGEVCRVRWRDIDVETASLSVTIEASGRTRSLRLPQGLLPLLKEGVKSCPSDAFIFLGRREGKHLSTRMAEFIVHRAAETAQIGLPVTSMSLRPALTHNTFLAPRRAGMAANRRRSCQNNGLRGKNQAGDGAAIAAERSE